MGVHHCLGHGANDRYRLLDGRIVDVPMRHEPQGVAAPGTGLSAVVERQYT